MDFRPSRRQARLEAVLDAAMALASEDGIEALTIPRLCERLQMSIGGLYRYFASKEALLVALQERAIREYDAAWREALTAAEGNLGETAPDDGVTALFRILVAFSFYLDDAVRAPLPHRLMDSFLSNPAMILSNEQAAGINAILAPILVGCGNLLHQAADLGALAPGDPGVRTHVLWATLHGLDHFRKRDRIQPPPLQVEPLLDASLRTLLSGWGAPAEALDRAVALWRERRQTP